MPNPRLRKQKRIATALLIGAFSTFVVASIAGPHGFYPWLLAASEAAMVGGLADWFAVVALFRHPLGIPFPHTAILPRSRDRLALQISVFIREHFLQDAALLNLVRQFRPADSLSAWLSKTRNQLVLVELAQDLVKRTLALADVAPLRKAVADGMIRQLQTIDLSGIFANLLLVLTKDGRHQELLSDAIAKVDSWLEDSEVQAQVAQQLQVLLQGAYPRLFSWLRPFMDPQKFSASLSSNIITSAKDWLRAVREDPEHEKRKAFDTWLSGRISAFHKDESLQSQIANWRDGLLSHPAAQEYAQSVLEDLRCWILSDLRSRRSKIRRLLLQAIAGASSTLSEHASVRQAIDGYVEQAVRQILPTLQDGFSQHIAQTIRSWPIDQMVEVLEDGIGSDLQYIRMNGTIVGAMLGLLIHCLFVFLS